MKTAGARFGYLPFWDQWGLIASMLCLVHCLATPILLALLPGLGAIWVHEDRTHQVMAWALLGISALAFAPGFRLHRKKRVLVLMTLGLGLILFAAFFARHDLETPLTLGGSLLLIWAHVLNRSFCRYCSRCEPNSACTL